MPASLTRMMENETLSSYFYFTSFNSQGLTRYVFFSLGLMLYVSIVFFNTFIIAAIILDTSLHKPMYILISCLSANALYGSFGLFPRLLLDLHSDIHTISHSACFIQIFIIYTYASYEFTLLTAMAYDRYIAICQPLQYHSIMTVKWIALIIAGVWIYPMFTIGVGLFLTVRLPLCGNKIVKLYCSNWAIVRLSCVSTTVNNLYGFFVAATTIFMPFAFILYTYVQILIICQRSSSALYKQKALHTCLPHIVSFANYSIAMFCEITFSRYKPGELPEVVLIILSLEYLIIPPLLNPLVYGLNFPEIRRKMSHVACERTQA